MQDLTDRFVQSAKARDGKRADFFDKKVRGLMLRVTPNGVKTWSYRYSRKSDSKRIRMTIGQYPAFTLSEARDEALKIMGEVARRQDPAKERKRGDRSVPRTFGELAARYLTDHAAKKRSGFKDEQMLKKDVLPLLEGEPLGEIKRVDITMILDGVVRRGAEIQANRVFEVIQRVFGFAVEKGFMEVSPVLKMKAPSKPRSRTRKLSHDELRIFWRRLVNKANMSWQTRMVLRLCLVTGQRVDEVCGARKSELDLDRAEWFLPGDRVKNNTPHLVPLSPLAVRLFRKAEARAGRGELIFPNKTTGSHLTAHAVAVAMRRSRPVFGFKSAATPHDLRRTLASGLAEPGFPRILHDKVLNHVHGDRSTISGVYDRYEYLKEKRQALESWASHLARIAFGESLKSEGNVVLLRQSSSA
jgi:integrase